MKNLRQRAIVLRQRGWSYGVISQRLGLAKSTISDWVRTVPYQPNRTIIARIRAGPAKAATTRNKIRTQQIRMLQAEGIRDIGKISHRDLWLLGLGLYVGEGSKLYEMVRIVNGDPDVIRIAMRWFREVCHVPDCNFAVAVHLYPDTPVQSALVYWSRVTSLPLKQFEKVQVDRRQNKSAKKKGTLPQGTAHIKIRSRGNRQFGVILHRRIMGWIEAVYGHMRV